MAAQASMRRAAVQPAAAMRSKTRSVSQARVIRPAPHSRRPVMVLRSSLATNPKTATSAPASPPLPAGSDPWEDPKWQQYKWTVYRGVAYDLTAFIDRHPAGSWLINLAIGRDCTALFESYHLRPEVAVANLKRLPVLSDFPVDAVPRSPYPNDSELYNAIRERVRKEVFKGTEVKGAHRSGSEWAALTILSYAVASYSFYASFPNVFTGFLLGLGAAWIGLTVQHCGNHGAMSTNPLVNNFMGLCNDLAGGSSLMWRYHHQVSHHVHCNDAAFDEDVFNAAPFLRFDARQPREWYHQFQHIYMWLAFPLLILVFQVGDIQSLFSGRTKGTSTYGATQLERASVVVGKLLHYALVLGVPLATHDTVSALSAIAACYVTQGVVLASTFAVSHNIDEAKALEPGSQTSMNLERGLEERDWGEQQVLTSANWGGVVGNFFTGGLNLQIEHHLFPAISFMHYPAIAKIVEDECRKRGVQYAHYDTLPEILSRFVAYMRKVGLAEQQPSTLGVASVARL